MELSSVQLCLMLVISGSVVQAEYQKPSKNLLTFLNLLSGYFTNKDQVKFESQNPRLEPHISYTAMFKPVLLKGLEGNITFYFEDTVNGKVVRQRVWVISEDCYGVIFAQNLKVLGLDHEKPCKPEEVRYKDYASIRFEPNNRPECQTVLYSVDQNVFAGTILDCHSITGGVIPKYSMTLTCQSASFVSCQGSFAGKPQLPTITFKNTSYVLPQKFTHGVHYASSCGHY